MLLLKVDVTAVNYNFPVIVVFCEELGDGSEINVEKAVLLGANRHENNMKRPQ